MKKDKRITFVVDASVAVKWFQTEEKSREALRLLNLIQKGRIVVYLPQLFFVELVNVLTYKMPLSTLKVEAAIDTLFLLKCRTGVVSSDLLKESHWLSRQFGISVYDACYVSLAKNLNCKLITADCKLKEKVKLPWVKML